VSDTLFISPESEPSGDIFICVRVPDDTYCIAAFLAALSALERAENWQSMGGMSSEAIAAIWAEIVLETIALPSC
jgi:hypothetical protein